MIVAAIIVLLILLIVIAVGGYLFFAACGKQRDVDWLDEESLKKTPYGQFYTHVKEGFRWLQRHHAQDVWITNREGLRLHAKWVPVENACATVIMAHGYHSCVLTDFALAFQRYHDMGVNLLLPDQRCHGQSEGRFTTFGVKESQDFIEWLQWHNQRAGELPVIFSGLSMGASTVMYLADQPLPDNVRGFIADCGFSSPKEIISKVFTDVTHLPAWPFIWVTEIFARLFGGFSLTEKDSCKTLAANTRPIVLVHGVDDDFVPCDMTRKAYVCCAADKELLLVEGAGHGVSFLKAKEQYLAVLKVFYEKTLGVTQ